MCDVVMGHKYCSVQPMPGIVAPPYGYHSVEGSVGGLVYPEYIIYNSDQVVFFYSCYI